MLRIVSGGQTGVDRAALDLALERGIPCGGWCPAGRPAEDSRIPDRYPMQEMESVDYPARTRANVNDADFTLILTEGPVEGGTALTVKFCRAKGDGRAWLVVDLAGIDGRSAGVVADHIVAAGSITLNVAGPRESKRPGIYGRAKAFLAAVLDAMKEPS